MLKQKRNILVGSETWEILGIGVKFKLKCTGCGHIILIDRPKALKMITKKIEEN